MKIAITAHGEDCQSAVDSRFGRASYFVFYDQKSDTWTSLPNTQNLEAAHGAGIQAGQTLGKAGAQVLITGYVGPKAFRVLQAEQISVYSLGEKNGTAEEALAAFFAGELPAIAIPNALESKK